LEEQRKEAERQRLLEEQRKREAMRKALKRVAWLMIAVVIVCLMVLALDRVISGNGQEKGSDANSGTVATVPSPTEPGVYLTKSVKTGERLAGAIAVNPGEVGSNRFSDLNGLTDSCATHDLASSSYLTTDDVGACKP
jgi:hypothetical protein